MPGSLSRMLRHGVVLVVFGLLAVGMTWPLAQNAGTHVVKTKWFYDSMVNLHVLGSRFDYAFGRASGLKTVYDNYFCAPTQYSIAHNESHFGLVLLYAPFYAITNDALLSYNLLILLCLALSGFCAYLFVRELTGHTLAALLAGVGYAFCPYIFFELGRVQLVAAQWVPLFALFLHRAGTKGDLTSLVALGLTFVMQVGSCLYYAMFLVVYGGIVGTWLVVRNRMLTRPFLLRLGAAGAVAGVLAAFMVYPYFKARKDFGLTRSEELTSRYSGKLEDFSNVYPHNRTLTFLHDAADGPDEPIAFPGFTLLLLALVALAVPVISGYRRATPEVRRSHLHGVLFAFMTALGAVLASIIVVNALAGLVVVVAAIVFWRRSRAERVLPPLTFLYLIVLLASAALFLGPWPFEVNHEPMPGLYYYLYRYAPGFNGIRYVSRFSVLIMLALAVLAGYGGAWLLSGHKWRSAAVFALLLAAMLFELRNAPVVLAQLPHKRSVSPVYKWLAQNPGPEPIATMPAYTMGYYGARNDYLALFHRRRTIDGKSSWMPPSTYTFIYEARRFPRMSGIRLLQALGAKYLVLHTEEMRGRGPRAIRWLDARPELVKRRFSHRSHYVYEILPSSAPEASLLSTPALPEGAMKLQASEVWARAMNERSEITEVFDGDPETSWTSKRDQTAGDWFEVGFVKQRNVVAIELQNVEEAFALPAAFKVFALDDDGEATEVFVRPELRYYADQVYHPRTFVFRVVLPKPVLARGLRVELLDTVANRPWEIHEASVWAAE